MSTHNICFHEVRILCGYPLLFGAMFNSEWTYMYLKDFNTILQRLITSCSIGQSVADMIVDAGLGGSVGCAVRLETRRSRVQPPPKSATFFHGD